MTTKNAQLDAMIAAIKSQMGPTPAWSDELKALIPAINPHYQFPADILSILFDVSIAVPVGLVGHTGCGKSSLVEQIAAHVGWPVIRLNLNQQSNKEDLVGVWNVQNSTMEWLDGRLPAARRSGAWILFDEFDFGESMVLSALHPVLEHDQHEVGAKEKKYFGDLCLKERNGEMVPAHPSHRMFITGNTLGQYSQFRHLYPGTQLTNMACINRVSLHVIEYMSAEKETELLVSQCQIHPKAAASIVRMANMVRQQFAEGTIRSPMSTRNVIDFTVKSKGVRKFATDSQTPIEIAAKSTILNKCADKSDADAIWGIMQRIFFDATETK